LKVFVFIRLFVFGIVAICIFEAISLILSYEKSAAKIYKLNIKRFKS